MILDLESVHLGLILGEVLEDLAYHVEQLRGDAEHRCCGVCGRAGQGVQHGSRGFLSYSAVSAFGAGGLGRGRGRGAEGLADVGFVDSHEGDSRFGREGSFVGVHVGFVVDVFSEVYFRDFPCQDLSLYVFMIFTPDFVLLSSELDCIVDLAHLCGMLCWASQMRSEADVI